MSTPTPTLPFADLPEEDRAAAERVFDKVSAQMSAWIDARLGQLRSSLQTDMDTQARALAEQAQSDLTRSLGAAETQVALIKKAFDEIDKTGLSPEQFKAAKEELSAAVKALDAEIVAHREKLKDLGKTVGNVAVNALKAAAL